MPPRLALLGIIGGPLIFASSIAVLFGAYEQNGAHVIFSVPEAAFEPSFRDLLDRQGVQAVADPRLKAFTCAEARIVAWPRRRKPAKSRRPRGRRLGM